MPTFEPGTIIRVPFPYVDKERRHHRPALVISHPVGPTGSLIWALMVTAAENDAWPGDVAIGGTQDITGLPIPSIVRTAKVATVEVSVAATIGKCPRPTWMKVQAELRQAGIK